MPKKKITLEEFEARHADKVWTEKSARALAAGEKKCSRCYDFLPLSMFTKYISQHGKKKFCAYCYDCAFHFRKPWIRKKRTLTKLEKQMRRDYYEEHKTELLTGKKAYYEKNKAENTALILETKDCEVCGKKYAGYFWRKLDGAGRAEWVVLHKSCHEQAERDGLIPKHKRLRKKKELRQ